MDEAGLTRRLDACLLADEELEAGPAGWRGYADPFPAWTVDEDGSAAAREAEREEFAAQAG